MAQVMTMSRRSPLEIGFKVWENSQGWCWLVVGPHNNRGTIGAAATEADAIRDVRSLVEDLSAQHSAPSQSVYVARIT